MTFHKQHLIIEYSSVIIFLYLPELFKFISKILFKSLASDETLRLSIFVTGYTVLFCLFRRDPPDMGFVALFAFHSHNLDVGVMLSDIYNIFVA